MSIATLLPLILIVGVMFMMTRSAKNKQRQQQNMRNTMEPGSGIRTIGGLYGRVVAVNEDTVELEIAEDVTVHFAKNAIAAVLDEAEYDRVVNGVEPAVEADSAEEPAEEAETAETAEAEDAVVAAEGEQDAEKAEQAETDEAAKDEVEDAKAAVGEQKKDTESVSK